MAKTNKDLEKEFYEYLKMNEEEIYEIRSNNDKKIQ